MLLTSQSGAQSSFSSLKNDENQKKKKMSVSGCREYFIDWGFVLVCSLKFQHIILIFQPKFIKRDLIIKISMRCKTHKTLSNIRNASKKHLFGIIVQCNKKYIKTSMYL